MRLYWWCCTPRTVNFVLVCVIVLSLNKNKYIMDGPWYSIVYEEMKTTEQYLMTYNVTLFVAKFSLIVSKIKNKCVEIKTYQLSTYQLINYVTRKWMYSHVEPNCRKRDTAGTAIRVILWNEIVGATLKPLSISS